MQSLLKKGNINTQFLRSIVRPGMKVSGQFFKKMAKGNIIVGTAVTVLWDGVEFVKKGAFDAEDWGDLGQKLAVDLGDVVITSFMIAGLAVITGVTGGVGLFVLGGIVAITYGLWDPLNFLRPEEEQELPDYDPTK